MKICYHVLTLLPALACSQLLAEQKAIIEWGSDAYSHATDSSASNIDESFIFELGSFNSSFNPSDRSTWAASWNSVDRTTFNEDGNFFQQTSTLDQSNIPPSQNSRPYIWGYRNRDGSAEWILLSNPNWAWPTPTNLNLPIPTRFLVSEATTIETGFLDPTSGSWATQQAADSSPKISLLDWKKLYFPNGEESEDLDDPDGDGLSNRLEYFLGSNPLQITQEQPLELTLEKQASENKITVKIFRSSSAQSTQFSIQSSTDLKSWSNDHQNFTLINESPHFIQLEWLALPERTKYFRLDVGD